MPLYRSQKSLWSGIAAAVCSIATLLAPIPSGAADAAAKPQPCPSDDTGLTLPQGFCATIFADGIGHARHLVAAANGVVYVNTWSGRYYGNDTPHAGGFLVALQDTTGSGKADINQRFGDTAQSGAAGGTGIGIYNGALYAELNDKILRFTLGKSSVVPADKPQTVISGLPLGGDHPMHPFAIDAHGGLYIDVASATNSCQEKNRTLKSQGMDPCTELQTRGGIWRYEANKKDQVFSAAQRYATGIRNAEGFGLDAAGRVFVTQHGRDQLHTNWPDIIKEADQEATLPAEELLLLKKDGDYGWPFCYYDAFQQSLVLAPEYGGDGKTVGLCAKKSAAVAIFPAHWAPNAMVLYDAAQFPARYRKGVFIAFHGSWNRAPYSQGGYNVVYQGLSGEQASGKCEIFADGFAGADKSPGKAAHRPTGLAVGPDGALYVADDVAGRIYRIVYRGSAGADSAITPMPCPSPTEPAGPIAAARAAPPEGTHPDAGADTGALKAPAGATPAMVALGNRIYHGQVGGATCTGCHGADGTGSPLGPDLTGGKWLWSNGSYQGIASTIAEGVAQPKQFRAPMPAMGGAQLSSDQLFAVAAYVWALSHH
jgi:glucose/arabinose dehydrogenase/mono/diheme cytochrome c family protein